MSKRELKQIKEIAKNIVAGGDVPELFSKTKYGEFKFPIYSNGIDNEGLYGFAKAPRITEPTVTVAARGTIGVCFKRTEPYVPIVRLLSVFPKEGVDLTYLYHCLTTLKHEKNGSIQQQLTVPMLSDMRLYVTEDYQEQQKIAKVLSTIDEKIELNNKINSELEAMARELYEYWFVQFDFPDENGKPYKSSGGKMVWNDELNREIPEGWEVKNIKKNSLTELIKPGIDNFNGEKTYLATAEVTNNDINFGAPKITYENRESRANMQPIENSVWFAKMKKSKKILYFGEYSKDFIENLILSTGFAGLKCKDKESLEYIWNNINNDYFESLKDRLSNGATQEAINNDAMAFIPVIIPAKNVLELFHKKTESIYNQIYINQLQNRDLAELRDFLLPMLMNGQVTVK